MICMQRTRKSFNCAQIRSTMQFSAICLQFLSAHDKLHSIVANYLMCLYIYMLYIYMCLLTDLSITKDMNCTLYCVERSSGCLQVGFLVVAEKSNENGIDAAVSPLPLRFPCSAVAALRSSSVSFPLWKGRAGGHVRIMQRTKRQLHFLPSALPFTFLALSLSGFRPSPLLFGLPSSFYIYYFPFLLFLFFLT